MKKTIYSLFIVPALLFISPTSFAGCNEELKEIVQTVEWYKDNKEVRLLKIENCDNNPGELAATPNCLNAHHAENMVNSEKRGLLNSPPIQFKLRGN